MVEGNFDTELKFVQFDCGKELSLLAPCCLELALYIESLVPTCLKK